VTRQLLAKLEHLEIENFPAIPGATGPKKSTDPSRSRESLMPRVLSVGQCALDHGMIARYLTQTYRADVVGASTFPEALSALKGGRIDLVLVNRVTDVDGTSGLDLIRTLKADPALGAVPVMLVSDRPDAQSDAVTLGAIPGFGKSQMDAPTTASWLNEILASRTDPPSSSG
jgi:two-component system chemotaxis response regulator CheY